MLPAMTRKRKAELGLALACLACACLACACGDDCAEPEAHDASSRDGGPRDSGKPEVRLAVEIGKPDPSGNLDFVPLADGDDIALGTFGQGGTHAVLAVRAIGFGNKAFVDVTL